MRNKIILSLGIATTLLLNPKFVNANSDSTKIYFQQAFGEVKNMLEGKQAMSFERAVFITENPYWNNQFTYQSFQNSVDFHTNLINGLIAGSNRENSIDFSVKIDFKAPKFDINTLNYTEKEKKEMYRKTLANWAIFKYISDTTYFSGFNHKPFTYEINDPFGMNDWSNSQVLHLLSKEQKGNCFALVSLFKIISDRLHSEAYICTAPQHIYIQHQDHKGDYYNVELATGTHPGDGTLQTLTYTYYEGIVSGISLRRLKEEKQNISLCLVNLGKSYEHKFKTKDDDFILQCAELALKYDSLNLNAMLLKEQVLEERVTKYAAQKNITDINKLKIDKNITATYKKMEAQIIKLYDLGYHQMPLYMQEMILSALKREDNQPIIVQDRTPNPFPSLKNVAPEDKRYSTLSGGLFEEVHEKKQFEQYGRFTIDTDKRKVIKLETENNFKFLIDPVVFAWSVDPLAHKMPNWSPYAAFADNPILHIDDDGRFPYTFHIRAFAPPGSFQGASGLGSKDDKRGYQASADASSRVKQNFTVDPTAKTFSGGTPTSDPSELTFSSHSETGNPTGGISTPTFGKNSLGSATASLTSEFAGSNPIYEPFSPNIKVQSAISITENLKSNQLFVAIDISSKQFPATEGIITDNAGNNVFLAGAAAFGNPSDLFSDQMTKVKSIDLIININNKGVFQSVSFGNKTYTLEEFNKIGTSKSAGPFPREDKDK